MGKRGGRGGRDWGVPIISWRMKWVQYPPPPILGNQNPNTGATILQEQVCQQRPSAVDRPEAFGRGHGLLRAPLSGISGSHSPVRMPKQNWRRQDFGNYRKP